jgi:hypothetical protein
VLRRRSTPTRQHGVPLNTVRELLGHSTVDMSLRYAHLAPDQRREAVAKLNERPLLTLTMRLQWAGSPAVSGYPVVPFRAGATDYSAGMSHYLDFGARL